MAREQVIWIDADGGQLNLNDWVNYYCPRNRSGIWSPPYTLTSTKMPLSEGSQFRGVTVGEGGIDLPLIIKAPDHNSLRLLLRDLSYRMNPTRGEGQLKIINGSDTRILYCYPDGIKKVVDNGSIAETTLSFTANDPFWYSDTPVTTVIQNSSIASSLFFSSTFFPLQLINSLTFALRAVENSGDEKVYPIWTITGPGDTIVLSNLSTGKTLSLGALTLSEGQELVIDTRTGMKTVKVDGFFGDPEYFSYVTKTSSLWSLKKGNNDLHVQMTNSNTNSKVRMDFTPRWGSL